MVNFWQLLKTTLIKKQIKCEWVLNQKFSYCFTLVKLDQSWIVECCEVMTIVLHWNTASKIIGYSLAFVYLYLNLAAELDRNTIFISFHHLNQFNSLHVSIGKGGEAPDICRNSAELQRKVYKAKILISLNLIMHCRSLVPLQGKKLNAWTQIIPSSNSHRLKHTHGTRCKSIYYCYYLLYCQELVAIISGD